MSYKYIDKTGKCKTCGQDHGSVTIELEHGGFITTTASAINSKPKSNKVPSRILSPDIFWTSEQEETI